MKTYRTKIGYDLAVPIALVLGVLLVTMVVLKSWLGLGVILFVSSFITHLFLTTCYSIDGNELIIRVGFYSKRLDIGSIRKISKSNSVISSFSTSFDRIEIDYNKFDTVLISPKEKRDFVNHLKELNPAITFNV